MQGRATPSASGSAHERVRAVLLARLMQRAVYGSGPAALDAASRLARLIDPSRGAAPLASGATQLCGVHRESSGTEDLR